MRTLTERIWAAHPLQLTHRAVLLAVARQVRDGSTRVMVNRQSLARDLETTPAMIGKALAAGEILGLCNLVRGVVEWLPEALPGLGHPGDVKPAVAVTEPTAAEAAAVSGGGASPRWVLGEFARQWEAKYGQRYHFTYPKDMALAKSLANGMHAGTLVERIKNFMSHPDQFYARSAHSFGTFASRVNDFAVAQKGSPQDDTYARIERESAKRLEEARQRRA